MIKKEKKVRN